VAPEVVGLCFCAFDNVKSSSCIFCDILAGRLPGSFVYRDDVVAAFMDIQPVNPGHLLVVPIRHAAHLADIDGDTAAHLMRVGHRLAAALRQSTVRCEGVNLFLADGQAALQEVFHVHLHVFPRFSKDGFGLRFSPEYHVNRPARETLDELAAELFRLAGRHAEDAAT
jgi:histidine triad (HIT) family protein